MVRHIGKPLLGVAVAGLCLSLVYAESATSGNEERVPQSVLMRAKVASAHKIMEGLVTKDFGEIRGGAKELKRICQATEWEAHADRLYAHYRAELLRNTAKLSEAADKSDADGAMFAYMNTLTTCVACHDHCRDVLKISTIKRVSRVIPIPTDEDDGGADGATRR